MAVSSIREMISLLMGTTGLKCWRQRMQKCSTCSAKEQFDTNPLGTT